MLQCPDCGSNFLDFQDVTLQEKEPDEMLFQRKKLVEVSCFACGWLGSLSQEGARNA